NVMAFNNNWATVYNQTFTNSPGSATIPSLAPGTYHVKVGFLNASWSAICEKLVDAVVSVAGSANPLNGSAREQVIIQNSKVEMLSSNPIKESIKLSIDVERKQKIGIRILDIQGRKLYSNSSLFGQGRHEIVFTPGQLPAGSYLLKVTGDTFTETKKIIRR